MSETIEKWGKLQARWVSNASVLGKSQCEIVWTKMPSTPKQRLICCYLEQKEDMKTHKFLRQKRQVESMKWCREAFLFSYVEFSLRMSTISSRQTRMSELVEWWAKHRVKLGIKVCNTYEKGQVVARAMGKGTPWIFPSHNVLFCLSILIALAYTHTYDYAVWWCSLP